MLKRSYGFAVIYPKQPHQDKKPRSPAEDFLVTATSRKIIFLVRATSLKIIVGILLLLMCFLGAFTNSLTTVDIQDILTVKEIALLSSNQPKYLLYFSQAGWANQQRCLQNAYVFAKLLNRILLLPPILPHWGLGATNQLTVLEPGGLRFKEVHNNNTDPFYHYLQRLPKNRYFPMTDVVDINVSLPGVQTLDAKVFRQEYYHENLTTATIEIDYGYSHYNTMWTYNDSELEGIITDFQVFEYGKYVNVSRTYRDLPGTFGRDSKDVLVLLDSFLPSFHDTVTAAAPPWRPRMTSLIRDAVRSTVATGWPPYVAIHLRTRDGHFQYTVNDAIQDVLSGAARVILEWLDSDDQSSERKHDTIGLYVATDLSKFREHPTFAAEAANLIEAVYDQHHVKVLVMSLADASHAMESLGGILYADIFLDLQLSVCASIGFQGTLRSTFSKLIEVHRQADEAC